ncbi:MAG: helix-turn-helix domain-containing protein [Clostridia bacterium]|nr:helix-turn-helix domain-containing protein [Clostridia bacterium]
MDQKKIGSFLKELRKEKGLTQEQVANTFNVTNRTVSRWETGSNMPDISLLVAIAEFYDVDVREIIDGERKSDNMDKEVKEVAEKMADYAGQEKRGPLKFIRGISIACVALSGLLLAGRVLDLISDVASGMGTGNLFGVILLVVLFVFSAIIAFYTNGKLKANTKKDVAFTAIKILVIFAICIHTLLLIAGFFVIGIVMIFEMNPFNNSIKRGIKNYDKAQILEKYGGDMNSQLYVFPDGTSKMIDPEYKAYFHYGLLDTDAYIILSAKYSEDDFRSEVERLSSIEYTTEYKGEEYTTSIKLDKENYYHPAYVAVDGMSSVYEYALVDENSYEITYMYLSYPKSFLKAIDDDYLKKDQKAYKNEEGSLGEFSIYYYYDSEEGLAVMGDDKPKDQ